MFHVWTTEVTSKKVSANAETFLLGRMLCYDKHMASSKQTADDIVRALDTLAPDIRVRKMFGEYALYYQDVVVGFICDDRLFLKVTSLGLELIDDPVYGKPYPAAKDYLLLDDETVADETFFTQLVRVTKDSLPPKKVR